jgi:hypothetical protein
MSMSEPNLAPALNELLRQFDALADEVQRDPSKLDAAQEHLGTITTVDAQGFIWGLNADGIFFRAVPNGQWEQVDPALFAETPGSTAAPTFTAPSFASPVAPVNPTHRAGWPPTGADQSREFHPPQPVDSRSATSARPDPAHPNGDPYAKQSTDKKKIHFKNPLVSNKTRAPRDTANRQSSGGLLEKFKANKRPVIIAAILLVVVVVVVVEQGKKTTPPVATTTTTVAPTTTTVLHTSASPSVRQEDRTVALVESGRVATASSGVAAPGSSASQYFNTAVLYGFARTHLTIRPVGSVVNGAQTWNLLRGTSVISSAPVTWTHVRGGWKITSWPIFSVPTS